MSSEAEGSNPPVCHRPASRRQGNVSADVGDDRDFDQIEIGEGIASRGEKGVLGRLVPGASGAVREGQRRGGFGADGRSHEHRGQKQMLHLVLQELARPSRTPQVWAGLAIEHIIYHILDIL